MVDLYDRPTVASLLREADAAIHSASPGDASNADLDSAMVAAVIDAFAGTGKPNVHTSGDWVYGNNCSITDTSPFNPPALVSWREPIEQRALGAQDMRTVVVVSSVGYGHGGGAMPGILLSSPRDADGNLIMLGSGRQHWSTVHVADLANFFRRAVETDSARGYYVIGDGRNSTVAELTQSAAVVAGAPGAVPGSDEEARVRLGDYFAEVLLLDQSVDATRARSELGWQPTRPSLVDEFRHGSYHKEIGASPTGTVHIRRPMLASPVRVHDERTIRMATAEELLHSNSHEVFSERTPERRWAAVERTYTEDVRFIDPDEERRG